MKDLISSVWKGISKTRYKKWSKLRDKDINIHIQVLFQKKRLNVPLLQNTAVMKTSLKSQMAGSIIDQHLSPSPWWGCISLRLLHPMTKHSKILGWCILGDSDPKENSCGLWTLHHICQNVCKNFSTVLILLIPSYLLWIRPIWWFDRSPRLFWFCAKFFFTLVFSSCIAILTFVCDPQSTWFRTVWQTPREKSRGMRRMAEIFILQTTFVCKM